MSHIEAIVKAVVDDIFRNYQQENSDENDEEVLTRDKAREFVIATLKKFDKDGTLSFDKDDFEKTFDKYDEDGSDAIEKDEMYDFVTEITGLKDIIEKLENQEQEEGFLKSLEDDAPPQR